ncbi:uncharacterized protein LOC108667259 isoform X2 [Hyalella azteca]|uniref:Uncharacterized protein LOC108667259 isoform X2 n=1 Tax=Hyalella azteca TaxID=294128 RepID=A0A8B7N8Z5_HYAAZ|nr:uncharacterized protein LOC108667259 isoform X2 [Hyalella azteca]
MIPQRLNKFRNKPSVFWGVFMNICDLKNYSSAICSTRRADIKPILLASSSSPPVIRGAQYLEECHVHKARALIPKICAMKNIVSSIIYFSTDSSTCAKASLILFPQSRNRDFTPGETLRPSKLLSLLVKLSLFSFISLYCTTDCKVSANDGGSESELPGENEENNYEMGFHTPNFPFQNYKNGCSKNKDVNNYNCNNQVQEPREDSKDENSSGCEDSLTNTEEEELSIEHNKPNIFDPVLIDELQVSGPIELDDAQSLTHQHLVLQSAAVAVESALLLVLRTSRALLAIMDAYRESLVQVLQLLQYQESLGQQGISVGPMQEQLTDALVRARAQEQNYHNKYRVRPTTLL